MKEKNKKEKNYHENKCQEHECDCEKEECHCNDECNCGDNCHCDDNCNCGEECNCGDDCHCDESCTCGCQENKISKEDAYLNLARQLKADFDNYRKRTAEVIENARIDGIVQASREFFKAIDVLERAKKDIKDESTKKGVEMIEDSILSSLKTLGIEQIKALGEKFNHNLHSAVAVVQNDKVDNDIVVEEYQKGYILKDKVLRYSQVIINKNEKENK